MSQSADQRIDDGRIQSGESWIRRGFELCFSITEPLSRSTYILAGFVLALLKYAIELVAVASLTGQFFTPVDFVNPWLSSKAAFLTDHEFGTLLGITWILFTLPFVWIAISMTVRRAADVGLTPWWGLLMMVPLVNLIVMVALSLLPSGVFASAAQRDHQLRRQEMANAFRPPESEPWDDLPAQSSSSLLADSMWAILFGCATQVVVGLFSVWVMQLYGFILFFSTPVIAGATSGYVFNRRERYGFGANFAMVLVMNVFSFGTMLSVGLDGAICLFMAFPLLLPLSVLGALVGCAIATTSLRGPTDETRGLIGLIIFLPISLLLEPLDSHRPTHRVTTSVVIDAPIDQVWQQVIAFPEIDETPAWFFQIGIAAPVRARIDGQGVGACRYCEFTTGTFVEPITAWMPPRKLAFDVISQPPPMEEWTPFSGLHPPHLDRGFISERGEFCLEQTADGRTKLSGSTWYRIDVRPRLYWKTWADVMVHQIHLRVLNHIRDEAQQDDQAVDAATRSVT